MVFTPYSEKRKTCHRHFKQFMYVLGFFTFFTVGFVDIHQITACTWVSWLKQVLYSASISLFCTRVHLNPFPAEYFLKSRSQNFQPQNLSKQKLVTL